MNELDIVLRVSAAGKVVALTFDDGPNPVYTPLILSMLAEVDGKATFFMIGEQMEAYPDVVRMTADQGHEIGNHTYSHPYLTRLSAEECRAELRKNDELIRKLTGKRPGTFRPPFFDVNEQVASLASEEGYAIVGATNGDAEDWRMPGVERIYEKSLAAAADGSVLLFHDGYGDRSQTIEAVGRLIGTLSEEGFRFVTVGELISSR